MMIIEKEIEQDEQTIGHALSTDLAQDIETAEQNNQDDLFDHRSIITDKKQSQIRIDKFLMDRIEHVSRNKVQNAIRAGSITVDEQEVKPNYRVRPNQTISITFPYNPYEDIVNPEDIPLNIVYEDDDVMIINKTPGLVVHPGIGNHSGTLVNALAWYFKEKELPNKEGNQGNRPGLVHRIDKDTSGLMIVAKNEYAMSFLAKQFYEHTIERTYWALVWGQPDPLEGTIVGNIARHLSDRMKFDVFPEGDIGKHAITHYKTLEAMYYVSLVECKLETGRTHQIRVHMEHIGCPLFQDDRYGGTEIVKGTVFTKYKQFVMNCFKIMPRQALHAKTLGFIHPATNEWMQFDSELPEDFTNVLEKWRGYLQSRKDVM